MDGERDTEPSDPFGHGKMGVQAAIFTRFRPASLAA